MSPSQFKLLILPSIFCSWSKVTLSCTNTICHHMFTTSPIINRVISYKSQLEQWTIIVLGGVGGWVPGGGSLSLRGACRISHLVVPKQQNGSPNQQMVTPFQQNGYPRKYKMGCANYMVSLAFCVSGHWEL